MLTKSAKYTNHMNRIISLLFFICIACSFSVLYAQEKATPRKGEGVSAFLERNNRSGRANYEAFVKLNKKKLGKNNSLLSGVTYVLPKSDTDTQSADSAAEESIDDAVLADAEQAATVYEEIDEKVAAGARKQVSSTRIYEPLFGKALADVKVTSKRLSGACFYVISGHGGPDPGAIGKVGKVQLHEDEYAYDIALRLARNLMQEGAQVYIIIQDAKDGIRDDFYLKNSTRETCMGSPIPLNQTQRLKQRCDKVNSLYRKDRKKYKYCRTISIHVDSRSKKQQTDVFFYHAPGSAPGKRLAVTMRNTFQGKYKRHQPGRGFSGTVEERNLYVLRNLQPVSAFVELGNIQNDFDRKRLVMSSNRQALANWLFEGFLADFKRSN